MRFKAEIAIGLVVLAAAGFIIGVFLSAYSTETSPGPGEELPQATPEAPTSNYTTLIYMGQNICEGCHLSGKRTAPQAYEVKQHIGGGAYCLECHKIDHNTHPINSNVTCERCHGSASTPQIPAFRDGTISCAECHDYPDPLKASNGNLVVIHRPREVDCAKCHVDSCLKCHDEIKRDEKWEKRRGHFAALLKNFQQ